MQSVKCVFNKEIRLSDERWSHIVEGHTEMAGHRNNVLLAISDPDFVVEGTRSELLAVRMLSTEKAIVVVFKENSDDGFVLTAYFTSKLNKLQKRMMLWKK
jgi:hypothetical protein